jgi:hypothetical protein
MAFNASVSIKKVMKDYKGDFSADIFQELLTRGDISHLMLSDITVLVQKMASEFPDVLKVKSIG